MYNKICIHYVLLKIEKNNLFFKNDEISAFVTFNKYSPKFILLFSQLNRNFGYLHSLTQQESQENLLETSIVWILFCFVLHGGLYLGQIRSLVMQFLRHLYLGEWQLFPLEELIISKTIDLIDQM